MELIKGHSYNITTKAPTILGDVYKNYKLVGESSYELVRDVNGVEQKNAALVGIIPNLESDVKQHLDWYIFIHNVNGDKQIFSSQWIEDPEEINEGGDDTKVLVIKILNPTENMVRASRYAITNELGLTATYEVKDLTDASSNIV